MTPEQTKAQAYLDGRAKQRAMNKAVAAARKVAEKGQDQVRAGDALYRRGSQLMADAITLEETIPTTLHGQVGAIKARVSQLRKEGRALRAQGEHERSQGRAVVREAERARKAALQGMKAAGGLVAAGAEQVKPARVERLKLSGLLD